MNNYYSSFFEDEEEEEERLFNFPGFPGGNTFGFPVFVGRNSITGFRWSRNRSAYYGIDLDRIQSFQCY